MYYDTAIYWNTADAGGLNMDSLLVMQAFTARGRVFMAALCDGAAGMAEYAGGYLTKELMEWFYDGLPEALVKRNPLCVIRRHAERRIYKAQRRMNEYAEAHGAEYRGTKDYGVKDRRVSPEMAVSLLILWERKYILWNFGDNRIYRFSTDGRQKYYSEDFEMGTVKKKDVFLICSNVFIRRIPENEIADILALDAVSGILASNEMYMERCRRRLKEIGEAAIRKGVSGSMSAVCVRISSHKKKS